MRFQGRRQIAGQATRAAVSAFAIILCLLAATPSLLALELKEIRFWSLGDITRVVVQFDGEFRYKWARLENPPRVFFDLPEARLAVDGTKERGRMRVIPVNDPALKQIRYAENIPGSSRVVLDLAGDYKFTSSQLANPPRLIIEIRGPRKPDGKVEVSRTGVARPDSASAGVPAPTQAGGAAAMPPPQQPAAPLRSASTSPVAPATVAPPAAETTPTPARAAPVAPVQAGSAAAVTQTASVTATPAAAAPREPEPAPVAKPAARTATGQQSLTRALGLKIGRIVLDPGHGGKDQGTKGVSGLLEKDLVLDLAKRVKSLLEQRLGSEVMLTRDEDIFIPLEERTAIANRARADLFVSLHANSSPFRLASGPETYYLDFTSSRESMDLASRENASSSRSVSDLQDIVKKIALKDKRDESRDFAARMQRALFKAQATASKTRKRNRGVKAAPFIVLVGAEMPSILVEIGFLSNKLEEGSLKKDDYRQSVAEAIYSGLSSYIDSLSHFETTERAAREE